MASQDAVGWKKASCRSLAISEAGQAASEVFPNVVALVSWRMMVPSQIWRFRGRISDVGSR